MIFSVIIPVFNGSKYVPYAIESVLSQKGLDRTDFEIIVVNDGSSDDGATFESITPYLKELTYIEKDNGGVSSALNIGILEAQGDYICWLSHDDVFLPNKLARQMTLIEEFDSNRVVLFGQQSFINENGKAIWNNRGLLDLHLGIGKLLKPKDVFASLVAYGNKLSGCSVVIPKNILIDYVGFFNEDMRYIQDAEMWHRLALANCHFYIDDEVVVLSRVHKGQQTGKRLDRYHSESKALHQYLIANDTFLEVLKNERIFRKFFVRLVTLKDFECLRSAEIQNFIIRSKRLKILSYIDLIVGLFKGSILLVYRNFIVKLYRT
ncbi:MAG: family 2 glycosyl transferase [Idiomarinaceae bacterium]|nr:family 2 glycosyl transferase [Idiomarinaceae bacterium]|tara:strand:+ start:1888 stop:2850 length:963 start_codon:yes stop_codon:yes gene_type:complete